MDDVWAYDIVTKEWSFLYGGGLNPPRKTNLNISHHVPDPRAAPGAREYGAAFFDIPTGELYIFGGLLDPWPSGGAQASQVFATNTMFSYNIEQDQWIWVSGTKSPVWFPDPNNRFFYFNGYHGTKGVESEDVYPQSSFAMGYATDPVNRAFYVFGGAFGSSQVISQGNSFSL
jgi:hypothetical protein